MSLNARRSQAAAAQVNGIRATTFALSRTATEPPKDDPLQPLRAVADRVGKEVEQFAELVDHFHNRTNNPDRKVWHQESLRIVGKFKDIAESKVKELKEQSDAENKGELNKSVWRRFQNVAELPNKHSSNGLGRSFQSVVPSIEPSATPQSSNVQELRQWQAELATWDLMQTVIKQQYPEPGTDVVKEKQRLLAQVGGAMRYCPNPEIWNRFLLEDDEAKEKDVILRWLERTADNSESAIETITEQLQARSGKDTNTWTSGWLDTKSRLKQAKRLQSSEQPLDPSVGLKTSDGTKPLVTHLDPDAPTRQNRDLEESDDYYERAVWMVCYEMMRRGVPWDEIAEWCKERNEAWRGVSIGTYESHSDGGPNVAGPTVGYLFRRMCFYSAKGARTPYESAVYGLLSGHLDSIEPICRSWDDHLYARYKALLLSRFDGFLQRGPTPLVNETMLDQFVFHDEVAKHGSWETSTRHVIETLKKHKATAAQALSPLKLIQGSLISRDVDKLIHNVGIAIAIQFQEDDRRRSLIVDPETDPRFPTSKMKDPNAQRSITVDKYFQHVANDMDALRILVHIFIALKHMPLTAMHGFGEWAAMDNVIALYIEFLRVSKKISLIPIYATRLEAKRKTHCLARVLPDINNIAEQKNFVRLMTLYGVDAEKAITMNCELTLMESGLALVGTGLSTSDTKPISRFELLEATSEHEVLWPGQRIKRKIPGLDIEPKEESLIESLLWYHHIEKDYANTFHQLSMALQYLLLNGRIGAAEKLVSSFSMEALSLSRTEANCGYPFDFSQPGTEEQDEIQITKAGRRANPGQASLSLSKMPNSLEHARIVEEMRRESSTYQELQQLVRLIALFREWREEEDSLIALKAEAKIKPNTQRIKEIFETIQATFGTLFDALISVNSDDPHTLMLIRKVYLPEMVISYLSVAQTASFFIHREASVKAMDVAVLVADEDKSWLQSMLLETGRMTELVDTLALVSRSMLKMGDLVDSWKLQSKKRGSRGETSRIWDLNRRN